MCGSNTRTFTGIHVRNQIANFFQMYLKVNHIRLPANQDPSNNISATFITSLHRRLDPTIHGAISISRILELEKEKSEKLSIFTIFASSDINARPSLAGRTVSEIRPT